VSACTQLVKTIRPAHLYLCIIGELLMDKIDVYNQAFSDPTKNGLLYSRAKDKLIKEITIQQEEREIERCEFWIKNETRKEYEEPIDFSLTESERYSQATPTIEPFTEQEHRVVNKVSKSDCSSCNGNGIYCSECSGTGTVNCTCINGYNRERCSNCDGNGKVEVYDSSLDKRNIKCGDCDGSGRQKSIHSKCGGKGELDCETCIAGNRDIECKDCEGVGSIKKISAIRKKFVVRQNTRENIPSSIQNADHYSMSNPSDHHWETVNQETYDKFPENGDSRLDDDLLLPVPSGEKVRLRYTKEAAVYEKADLTLRTGNLNGNYDDNKLEHTVWNPVNGSSLINRINASRIGNVSYIMTVLYTFGFVGLWGGSIITLILMLPIAAINDYIITIPETILGLIAVVIFNILNLIILHDSIVDERYTFKV